VQEEAEDFHKKKRWPRDCSMKKRKGLATKKKPAFRLHLATVLISVFMLDTNRGYFFVAHSV
jgi:hypothetical protein